MPAHSGITTSAVSATGEPGSLVMAIVGRLCARAAASTPAMSGERPDCEIAITAPPRSNGGESAAYSHGAASATGSRATEPKRYWAYRAALSELPRPAITR